MPLTMKVSTLLEILAGGGLCARLLGHRNIVSTLLEILGLVYQVLVGF